MVENGQQDGLVTLWWTPLDEWLQESADDGAETVVRNQVEICQGRVYQVVSQMWMLIKLQP